MTYVAKRFYLEPIGLAVLFRSYLDAVEKGIPSLIEAEVSQGHGRRQLERGDVHMGVALDVFVPVGDLSRRKCASIFEGNPRP